MNIQHIKVQQMNSPKSGNPVANQFTIQTEEGVYFQSYRTIIAFKANDGTMTLDEQDWNYSRTTSKYRNEFTGYNTPETRAKIKSGEYKLANLN